MIRKFLPFILIKTDFFLLLSLFVPLHEFCSLKKTLEGFFDLKGSLIYYCHRFRIKDLKVILGP